ncbi:PREDICTED: integrin alpha-1 isoform X1 [Poecilia mexicana]|uniref:VWFA domain-containing protein n=1 Tax=Poecilia mexicana TaxID=48701 RepID=A0A3B3X0V7_9TELE|nr:PREDICTED: integrin alpha-1 isoform X1 [Poecilia mexicana]
MLRLSQFSSLTAAAVVVLLTCVLSFNVDQKNGLSFSGPLDDMFGYSVQQFENSEGKWVLIGSPHSGQPAKRTGDVYKCPVGRGDNTCIKLELPTNTTVPNLHEVKENMTMGTTLVTNPTGGFMACGPQYGYMCGQQQYISGVCTNVSPSFQILNSIAPGVQNCTSNMDIVFVLDGSNSIYPWKNIVDFLIRFLREVQVGPKQAQVGIVSYGEDVKHHVNLSQFNNNDELLKFVKKIPQHLGTKTHTFLAIDTARKEAFTQERGARSDAKKVMVILTDGESHDHYLQKEVIGECDQDNIERFGIAVLGYYKRENKSEGEVKKFVDEIKSISSKPTQDHFFNVSDEVFLVNLADTLGRKIFALEATSGNLTSSFDMEMSQAGFSAHAFKDGLLLGAVGAYDWNGTVVMQTAESTINPGKDEFYDPKDRKTRRGLAEYLGYDVQSASTPEGVLYITGAPRYNHTGRVVIYRLTKDSRVETVQILRGEQIGSYFGSVLQTVDVNNDSFTDLLLVGAPMYMGPERDEQGKVYVYKLNERGKFVHKFDLNPMNQSCCSVNSDGCAMKNEPCGARFGTAIAAVSDLNLDGLNDVVIGAPFENDHRGAVYIYHGHQSNRYLKLVQHIPAGGDGEKVKFFGQSIHGIMDLNGDGIVDVTIGGLGGASLFWSRDVAELTSNMTLEPAKINLQHSQFQCEHKGHKSVCVNTTVCFQYRVKSEKRDASFTEMSYNITLDLPRAKARASFIDQDLDKSDRRVTKTFSISNGQIICKKERFIMSARLDFKDPINVTLEFGLTDEDKGPVLDASLPTSITKTIPLVDCGDQLKCITDLSLTAEPSEKSMLIQVNSKDKLDVKIDISNKRDNAYNTKVILSFTPNINYVKVEPEKECTPDNTKVECAVGYPFLGSKAKESFKVRFETDSSHIHENIYINVTTVSDSEENPNTLHDNSKEIFIPVKYEAGVIFSVSHSQNYITIEDGEQSSVKDSDFGRMIEEVNISYTVEKAGNTLTPALDLNVIYPYRSPLFNVLLFPTRVVYSTEVKCKEPPAPKHNKPKKETLTPFLLECGQSLCDSFTCSIPETNKSQVNVTFKAWKPTFTVGEFSSLKMMVNASLTFKQNHLFELGSNAKTRNVTILISKGTIEGIPLWIIILLSTLAGLLILALIILIFWKLGFFKRKTMDYSKEEMSD